MYFIVTLSWDDFNIHLWMQHITISNYSRDKTHSLDYCGVVNVSANIESTGQTYDSNL